jgi:iron(III) transport system substrate-binding protein
MPLDITRRTALAGLSAASAIAPTAARADTAALEEAARKEGSLTWYIAQVDGETAEKMGKAFTTRYPGIKVSVIRTTGQVAYERLSQDLRNNIANCDVFSTTDVGHIPALKRRNALMSYTPPEAAHISPAFKGLEDPGYAYPTTSTLMLIIANTARVKPEDMPASWNDLLDPKWKGRVAFGHPGFSGYVGVWTVQMRKLYGWQWFEKLAANKPRIGRSGNDPISLLNAGECLVGLGPLSTTLLSASKGNPLKVIYPSDGSVVCVGPSAIPAAAPHPNAAKLFLNWMLSEDFARLCIEQRIDPARGGMPPIEGAAPLMDVKLLRVGTDELVKAVPEVIEQWRETFS